MRLPHHKPAISVVVPTRNRAAHARACVVSILRNVGFLELIVVDQSDDDGCEIALSTIRDPRLRYVRTKSKGACNARNEGHVLSSGTHIAFTDDDCRPSQDWISRLTEIIERDEDVAVVCGRVRVPEEIRRMGFAESFEPRVREWRDRLPPFGSDWGITANMTIRRDVLTKLDGFDPMLGAGAPLRSGEETDLLYRILRAGYKVVNAKEVLVDHLGLRVPGKDMTNLVRGYGLGTGAAIFKHAYLGDRTAIGLYVRFLGACLLRVLANLATGRRPTFIGYTLMFISGLSAPYRFGVNRQQRRFLLR